MEYNTHELKADGRYGVIVNSHTTMYLATVFANEEKKKTGKDYVVVRGSLCSVYTTK